MPSVLHDEIVTNPEQSGRLLPKFRQIILCGGYFCPSARMMAKKEGQTLQPYGFLSDLGETSRMRRMFQKGAMFGVPRDAEQIATKHRDTARFLLDTYQAIATFIGAECLKEACYHRQELEADRSKRFRFWAKSIDKRDMHTLSTKVLSRFTNSADSYCLSAEWVSWHWLRLASILAMEYHFLRKGSGSEAEWLRAEHDLHDLEYVLLLSRADGLLTRDKKLVEPLARAAFPDKDVFSSLDEVPGGYRCNWR